MKTKPLDKDPRELGILCSICSGFMAGNDYIKHKNGIVIKKCHGRPLVCDDVRCLAEAKSRELILDAVA
ncbi:hypothetical protein KKI24_07135 [bacterium]|nr:hypothetical protein [bacterium]